jgi:hypothetical protein
LTENIYNGLHKQGSHSLNVAEKLDDEFRNRRQIFRIADPEFASMRVMLRSQEDYVECPCLDISATGIGVLVPQSHFAAAQAGVILQYQLFFGQLSPVHGVAIVANRAETSIADSQGPLIRLGLRFSDAEPQRIVRRSARERRSQRHFLPEALRPICICNDPLWFGEQLSIAVHDFSLHGMSGVVCAKRTVFAEGLRTVFRFAFPYIGVVEVPVRVIYANPTEDDLTFRIGCEFVRRSEAFTYAVETYFRMQLLDRPRFDSPLMKFAEPQSFLLSESSLIAEAEESFNMQLTESENPSNIVRQTLFGSIATQENNTGEHYFRFEVHVAQKSDSAEGGSKQLQLGSQALHFQLDELQDETPNDFRKIASSMLYFAVVRKVEDIRFVTSGPLSRHRFQQLKEVGLRLPVIHDDTIEVTYRTKDLLMGIGISNGLWWQAFLPLARFERLLRGPDFQMPTIRSLIIRILSVFVSDKPKYHPQPEDGTFPPV